MTDYNAVPPAPLTDVSSLKVGDVVQIAVKLTDKQTGQPFWWKRFACVTRLPSARSAGSWPRHFTALTLKMQVDRDKDVRLIELGAEDEVVTKVPEERWPQGVIAMRMKWIHKGLIKLDQS